VLKIQHVLSFLEPTTPAPAEFTPEQEVRARHLAEKAQEKLGTRAAFVLRALLFTDGQPVQALTDVVRATCKVIAPGFALAKNPDGDPSPMRYHGQNENTTRTDLVEAWICAHADFVESCSQKAAS
jgi:hypothetical protein